VLMLEAVGVNYPGVGIGPPPFSTDHPPPAGHPFTWMVSEPPAPPFEVEWMWMAVPLMGTLEAPVVTFGLPPGVPLAPVVIPALAVRAVEVSGGPRRRQRTPIGHGRSPPRPSSPRRDM
jgi:hypothetical protein